MKINSYWIVSYIWVWNIMNFTLLSFHQTISWRASNHFKGLFWWALKLLQKLPQCPHWHLYNRFHHHRRFCLKLLLWSYQTLNHIIVDHIKCSSKRDLLRNIFLEIFENLFDFVVHNRVKSLICLQKCMLNFSKGFFFLLKCLRVQTTKDWIHR